MRTLALVLYVFQLVRDVLQIILEGTPLRASTIPRTGMLNLKRCAYRLF